MTMDEPHAVLDELKSMAAEQGWTRVTGYVAQVATADRQVLVACAPGVDPGPLAAWLRGRDAAATVRTTELDALAVDPGPALAVDRVVIALRCGDLLMPATIAGAATVMGRSGGSYALVLTEVERVQGESDLAAVQRAVGGALLGPEGAARRAGRGLLLWTESTVPGFLVERVENDSRSLSQWLANVPDQSAELAGQRAACALALALAAEADAAAGSVATSSAEQAETQLRMLPGLRTSVAGLHARVLDHLDAQAVSLTRELTASLDTMRHDLLREIDSPADGRDPHSSVSLVTRRMSQWSEDAAGVIAARQAQSRQHAVELLDVIDWPLVNDLAPRSDGRRYPEPIVQSFTPDPLGVPPHRDGFALPPSGAVPGPVWAPALRTATVGGVVTAAALAALGVAVAPALGAAAVGVAAATMFGSRRGQAATRRRTETAAVDTAVRTELSRLMSVLSAELDAGRTKLRAATDAEFTDLDRSLAAAQEHASRLQAGPVKPDPEVSERLAKLRARLGLGAVSPADLTVLPTDPA
ncbi:MAG TPA: hypothetical protein VHN16_12825 [Streptosporangiaceae bacterium]|nr:hypothetical protein [Streptosporangiaceae bacterium]